VSAGGREAPDRPGDPNAPAVPGGPVAVARLGPIHHVGIVVADLDVAIGQWRDLLGFRLERSIDQAADHVRLAIFATGAGRIELLAPTDTETGVARFLASRGPGLHHVCFEVPDVAATLVALGAAGVELIDAAPRRGAEGPVAFLHPRSTGGTLVELIEAPGGPAWAGLGYEANGEHSEA
jgi:methylmalonyl-CoA/ethylmalonyl-CoA epimerase